MRRLLAIALSLLILLKGGCGFDPEEPEGHEPHHKGAGRWTLLVGVEDSEGIQRLALMDLATGYMTEVEPPARLLSPVAPHLWPSGTWGGFAYATAESVEVRSWDLKLARTLHGTAAWLRARPGGGAWAMVTADPGRVSVWSPLGPAWSHDLHETRATGLAWISPDSVIWSSGTATRPTVKTAPPFSTGSEEAVPLTLPAKPDEDLFGEVHYALLGTVSEGTVVGARVIGGTPLLYRLFVWDTLGDQLWEAWWTTCSPTWALLEDGLLLATDTETPCWSPDQPSHRFYVWNWREETVTQPVDETSPFPWVAVIGKDRWAYIDATGDLVLVQLEGRVRNPITPAQPLIYLHPTPAPAR